MVGFKSERSQIRVWAGFFGQFRADIRGDRGLMSDTFRITGALTDLWWACEGRVYAFWDHCQISEELDQKFQVQIWNYSHCFAGEAHM